MKILVVEDHPRIRTNLIEYLSENMDRVESARDGREAVEKISSHSYDAVVLDMNLPYVSWREVLEIIRKKSAATKVLVLTSNSLLEDKEAMFDLWADDYVVKPFTLEEIAMRLRALARRSDHMRQEIVTIGEITVDLAKARAHVGWETIDLGAKEFQVLKYLIEHRWSAKNKTDILEAVWGEAEARLEMDSTTLEVHISSLRKKLWSETIRTIRGIWYLID